VAALLNTGVETPPWLEHAINSHPTNLAMSQQAALHWRGLSTSPEGTPVDGVHAGTLDHQKAVYASLRPWLEARALEVTAAVDCAPRRILLIGISLGGALAQLTALQAAIDFPVLAPRVYVLAFGATQWATPRVSELFDSTFGPRAVVMVTSRAIKGSELKASRRARASWHMRDSEEAAVALDPLACSHSHFRPVGNVVLRDVQDYDMQCISGLQSACDLTDPLTSLPPSASPPSQTLSADPADPGEPARRSGAESLGSGLRSGSAEPQSISASFQSSASTTCLSLAAETPRAPHRAACPSQLPDPPLQHPPLQDPPLPSAMGIPHPESISQSRSVAPPKANCRGLNAATLTASPTADPTADSTASPTAPSTAPSTASPTAPSTVPSTETPTAVPTTASVASQHESPATTRMRSASAGIEGRRGEGAFAHGAQQIKISSDLFTSYWLDTLVPVHPFANDVAQLHSGKHYRSMLIGEHLRFRTYVDGAVPSAVPPGSLWQDTAADDHTAVDDGVTGGVCSLPYVLRADDAFDDLLLDDFEELFCSEPPGTAPPYPTEPAVTAAPTAALAAAPTAAPATAPTAALAAALAAAPTAAPTAALTATAAVATAPMVHATASRSAPASASAAIPAYPASEVAHTTPGSAQQADCGGCSAIGSTRCR